MKKYRRTSELIKDSVDLPGELLRDLVYYTWLTEINWPEDEGACVLLLDGDEEMKEVERIYPMLKGAAPELVEMTGCRDNTVYVKTVFVFGQDGSGVVVFVRNTRRRVPGKEESKNGH